MKKSIFIFILLISAHLCKSQEFAKVAYRYIYKHQIDTSIKGYYYTEKMILLQGEKTSLYKSYDAYLKDSTLQAEIKQYENEVNIILKASGKPVIRDMVLKDNESNKAIQIRFLLEYYYWDETLHKFDWQILSDTTTLNGLKCQKATCEYRGRYYTAWFSKEIKINNGPWKFGGLPGLIINISDSKSEIIFEFDGYAFLNNLSISLPERSHLSSTNEFNKVRDVYLSDPISFLQNSGNVVGNFNLSNMSIQLKGRKPINNPIELKEE